MGEVNYSPVKYVNDTWSDEEGCFVVNFNTNEFTYVNRMYEYTTVVWSNMLDSLIAKVMSEGARKYVFKMKVAIYNNKLVFGRTVGVEKYINKMDVK